MTAEKKHCTALTKAGNPCKNTAKADSNYCHVHRNLETAASADNTPPPPTDQSQFKALMKELNNLAENLQEHLPDYTPPAFSPQKLATLLKNNVDRFTPEVRLDILEALKTGVEGTSPEDFLDPDTWKGMWIILNYSIQSETETLREGLFGRLATLPGGDILVGLKDTLQGTSPKDFLDLDTWKGMGYILNYSLQSQVQAMRTRLFGGDEEE